jgi:hypothetical protein
MEAYIAGGRLELVRLPAPDGKGELRKNLIKREELDRFVDQQGRRA